MALHLVIGPPAAGKTTWCNAKAKAGDIIIDYDRIAAALTGPGDPDEHQHAATVKQVARAARAAAIDKALTLADDVEVYIIHATPSAKLLAEYRARGANVVTIDPGEAVVMARCKRLRPWQMTQAVKRWYAAPEPETTPTPLQRSVTITSFGFDRTPAPRAGIVVDARTLPNPHQVPHLRPRNGLDPAVAQWVAGHPETEDFIADAVDRICSGRAKSVTVAIGCSAGRHRSVAVAEALAEELTAAGHVVSVRHTEVGKPKAKARKGSGGAAKLTTTQAGLGWRHQQQRTYLINVHIDGTPCWWCAKPMHVDKGRNWDGKALAADHTHARTHGGQIADRLLHGKCNSERQEGDRDDTRPALSAAQSAAEAGGAPTARLRWPEAAAGG